ncbi:unnamed protein product [Parnassius apollo]|uniref:(apollo) hypothetical protein n=1 Tax=Parnassius apollo TaxID=110799 RepID=A0A8S3Y1R1_PARAO|nr:unnamed protein product [Parnassius apollo]
MVKRRYTDDELSRYLENSDEEPFSSGSDEEYQPNDEDEDIEDTEVIADFIASSAGRSTESPSPTPASSSLFKPSDAEWKRDVLPLGRETFIGNHGVQNIDAITEDGKVSLFKIYAYFVPDDFIDVMIIHTNNYAQLLKELRTAQFSRMTRWKDVTREELKTFFGVIIYMGLNPKPSIEHYWKLDVLYYNPLMHRINMSYNRFSSILRFWHFTEIQIGVIGEQRTHKIDPLIHKMVNNFRSLYIPSDIIVVNESMVKFHGRLQIRTYNPAKTDRYGMKIYKACTINSYTWSYQIYSGISHQLEGLDKPGSTVAQLTEPLLDAGRIIVADNYYTSLPLAEYLKGRNTDLCGTLRKNKRNLPEEVVKAKLRRGEKIARQKDNLYTVLKWHDKRDVLMISTCQGDGMSNVTTKRGDVMKSDAIIDYNDAKKGIDISDQLASFHSPLRKSLTWYKKIAIDLLFQVAIINASCIYNELADGPKLTVLQIQEHLVRHFLGPVASTTERNQPQKSSISCSSPRSSIAS